MYSYNITYYRLEDDERVPDTGLKVMLVRPGQHPATGLSADEIGSSGHYSVMTSDPADKGFYEIWDNRSGEMSFSGRVCVLGPTDTEGIQPNSITNDLIADGAVTGSKIMGGALSEKHFTELALSLESIAHEVQNEHHGKGTESNTTPALFSSDKTIMHTLTDNYGHAPIVHLINQSNGHLWLEDVSVSGGTATVTLGVGPNHGEKDQVKYTLLVLKK